MIAINSNKYESFKILSGNSIKIIAYITMFVDHFSKIVLSYMLNNVWFPMSLNGTIPTTQYYNIDNFIRFTLYGIGSISFPLFCFLIAEGYGHTQNKKYYMGRILLFALLSEIPFDIGFFSDYSIKEKTFPCYWKYQNVFFTYFIAISCLLLLERVEKYFDKNMIKKNWFFLVEIFFVTIAVLLSESLKSDYGGQGILFISAFYFLRKRRFLRVVAFLLIYIVFTGNQPTLFLLLSAIIMLLYSGQKGKWNMKWFGYIFYPAHIIILKLITLFL